MFWIITGTITFIGFAALLVYVFVHDRRFEKKSVLETMKKETFDEIAEEREQALARAKKFKEALEKAKHSV